MAAKTKAKIASIGQALGKKAKEFTFIDPPLIDAPHTTITKLDGSPRQLPDPSKTLKPAIGIERIQEFNLVEASDEKGPNGEPVFKTSDERIRFVGSPWRVLSAGSGTILNVIAGTSDEFMEITFYGTGLNLLDSSGSSRELYATIDGGSEILTTVLPDVNGVLAGRSYRPNMVYPVASGLTLGNHTIKLRKNNTGWGWQFMGFEILNEDTQIQVPQGEVFAAGNKFSNSALSALDYNSGFDGNPVLNGRGGRVSVYMTPEGEVKKAIQQTDATQLNLAAANHSNEEVIRRINFREFGANRSDDFSTLTSSQSDRAFTLDDGTTTLICNDSVVTTGFGGESLNTEGASAFITITFVGTGLDMVLGSDGTSRSWDIDVDGSAIGTVNLSNGPDQPTNVKIVSGLPYGTHTIRMEGSLGVFDFIVYGPKKPTIPADAQEINEYYLMADFSQETTELPWTQASGVLRKSMTREIIYSGANWVTHVLAVTEEADGFRTVTTVNSEYFEYVFFGTGFNFKFGSNTGRSGDVRVTINGQPATASNFPTAVFQTTATPTYDSVTNGSLDMNNANANGSAFAISNLPLDFYTVRMTQNDGTNPFVSGVFEVITPIHFPNTKVGSLSMGPGVQFQKETDLGGVDLSKAKAWIVFDGVNNEIRDSHNVSALVDIATGQYDVYLETPFKSENFAVVVTSNSSEALIGDGETKTHKIRVQTQNSGGTDTDAPRITLVCFGELIDEDEA